MRYILHLAVNNIMEKHGNTGWPWHETGAPAVENEVLIGGIFVSTSVLSYVVIPGLLIMWDRVLDHIGTTGRDGVQGGK